MLRSINFGSESYSSTDKLMTVKDFAKYLTQKNEKKIKNSKTILRLITKHTFLLYKILIKQFMSTTKEIFIGQHTNLIFQITIN